VNETVAAAQLANCILFHVYSRTITAEREHKQKLHIDYSTCWHISIFGDKLRTY